MSPGCLKRPPVCSVAEAIAYTMVECLVPTLTAGCRCERCCVDTFSAFVENNEFIMWPLDQCVTSTHTHTHTHHREIKWHVDNSLSSGIATYPFCSTLCCCSLLGLRLLFGRNHCWLCSRTVNISRTMTTTRRHIGATGALDKWLNRSKT